MIQAESEWHTKRQAHSKRTAERQKEKRRRERPLNVCRQCGWMWAGHKANWCSNKCRSAHSYRVARNKHQHVCKHCGKEYRSSRAGSKVCSPACNVATRVVDPMRGPRTCHQCGKEFVPKATYRTTYCSRSCWQSSVAVEYKDGTITTATGYCSRCGRRWVWLEGVRKDGKRKRTLVCDSCRAADMAAASSKRRAHKKNNGPHDYIVPRRVYKRDGFQCQLCGWTFKAGVVHPHPRSPTIDHVVPLSRGGLHTYDNVQAACLVCNSSKGARKPR